MFFNKLKFSPLLLVASLFSTAYFLIWPMGEFAVNDDWLFVRQVQSFLTGNFHINALIDPSFIAQGILGLVWAFPFGASFTSLRILTFLVSLVFLTGVYLILDHFNLAKRLILIVLVLLAFNPLVFTSSMSFMTEIYFLAAFTWSLYFYLKFLQTEQLYFSFLGTLFAGGALLIRQMGIVVFLAFLLILLGRIKRKLLPTLLSNLLIFVSFFISLVFWPRYGHEGLLENLATKESFIDAVYLSLYSVFYLSFFLSPLVFSLVSLKNKITVILMLVSIVPALWLFKMDLFPIGNVFYIEELYAKSNFRNNLSFFDNTPFKLILAFIISFSLVVLIRWLYVNRSRILETLEAKFLFLNVVGMFFILYFANDYYDRYLLPAFLAFTILLSITINKIATIYFKKISLPLLLLVFITFVLQNDFIQQIKLKWMIADKLSTDTGISTQISVDGVHLKYTNVKNLGDFTGQIDPMPVEDYLCFVERYTLEYNETLESTVLGISDVADKFFENPRIYGSKRVEGRSRAKNNFDKFLYNEPYVSLLYLPVGKQAFVAGWCNFD